MVERYSYPGYHGHGWLYLDNVFFRYTANSGWNAVVYCGKTQRIGGNRKSIWRAIINAYISAIAGEISRQIGVYYSSRYNTSRS